MKIWEIPGIIFDSIPGQEMPYVEQEVFEALVYDEKKDEMVLKKMPCLMGKEKIIKISGLKIKIMLYKEPSLDVYNLKVKVYPDATEISMRGIKMGEERDSMVANKLDVYTYNKLEFKPGGSYKILKFIVELITKVIDLVEKCEP